MNDGKDVARYQYLRNTVYDDNRELHVTNGFDDVLTGAQLDQALDAAIEEKAKREQNTKSD